MQKSLHLQILTHTCQQVLKQSNNSSCDTHVKIRYVFSVQETQQPIYFNDKYSTTASSDELMVFYLRIQQPCCHQMYKHNNYDVSEITLINIFQHLMVIVVTYWLLLLKIDYNVQGDWCKLN